MKTKAEIIDLIGMQGILPLFYHDSPDVSVGLLKALYKAGIRAIEYTNRGDHAVENFVLMRNTAEKDMPGMHLGIGTVRNIADAQTFIGAGAEFIVCPVVDASIGAVVNDANLLWIPGCLTPTEINLAGNYGARVVKIFPGSLLGSSYLLALREIFRDIQFMPTGGIELTRESFQSWFAAGAFAVGMGSKLMPGPQVQSENYDQLTQNCLEALSFVKSTREK